MNKLLQLPSVPEEKMIPFAHKTQYIEQRAMATVMEIERHQGYRPRDVSTEKCGYDIESAHPYTGELRFIEVKGRRADAETITVTKNEILVSLNKPEHFILAVVLVNGKASTTYYIERPFQHEIDFEACSVNYNLSKLLNRRNHGASHTRYRASSTHRSWTSRNSTKSQLVDNALFCFLP